MLRWIPLLLLVGLWLLGVSNAHSAKVDPPPETPSSQGSSGAILESPVVETPLPDPPEYRSLRYDEDYSHLVDPRMRSDHWDGLKYIPLSGGEERYFSLGGEMRQRYEFFHNLEYGEGPADSQGNNDWLLQRYLLHGDLHLGPNPLDVEGIMLDLMPRVSAGLLMYRFHESKLQVLLAHPGGSFFKNKDDRAWTIPKGEIEPGEDKLEAAKREFQEETGVTPTGPFIELTPIKQMGGKIVYAWAFEGDCDPSAIVSNTFSMEWPPKSRRQMEFPEMDRADFFDVAAAR